MDEYKNTLYLKDRVLSLPIHPYLKKQEVKYIAEAINRVEDLGE